MGISEKMTALLEYASIGKKRNVKREDWGLDHSVRRGGWIRIPIEVVKMQAVEMRVEEKDVGVSCFD